MIEEFLDLIRSHDEEICDRALSEARYGESDILLAQGELKRRCLACEDLFLAKKTGDVSNLDLLVAYARIADSGFQLRYHTGGQGKWAKPQNATAPNTDDLPRRTDNYLDRIMTGRPSYPSTFPKIDAALISLSYGLPPRLWEAVNTNAFNYYTNLERERRRGTNEMKPLLAFSDLDYLTADIQDSPRLNVYDDIQKAAAAGVRSARVELSLPPLAPEAERSLRMARSAPVAQVNLLQVGANKRLWFQFDLPEGFEKAQGLLFEIDDVAAEPGSLAEPNAYLLSTGLAHEGRLDFKDKFESPTSQEINYEFAPADNTSLVLLVTKPQGSAPQLSNLSFFKRTRNQDASIRLSEADLADLRDCILRFDPERRMIFRRRLKILDA